MQALQNAAEGIKEREEAKSMASGGSTEEHPEINAFVRVPP